MAQVVLVVHDTKETREMFTYILSRAGYRVVLAEDAARGLRAFTLDTEIDGAVINVGLPDRNGWELYRSMKRVRASARVVFTSGGIQDQAIARAINASGLKLLGEPFSVNDLLNAVAALL